MDKLIIQSKVGEVEIDPATIIRFPKGILGFPGFERYVILDPDENSPLKMLQSVDNPRLGFVITDPLTFKPDYKLRLYQKDLDEIEVKEANLEEVLFFVIVTIPDNPADMTANLKGPLIIGKHTLLGKQVIIDSKEYELKYPILKG